MTTRTGQIVLASAGLMIPVIAGCSGTTAPTPEWQPVAEFTAAENQPRIVVYGNLARHLPRFNPTPALDEFLYGPQPIPNALLRNPQGLAMIGTRLLVCDQGYPDVIGVDLASGISSGWADRDRAPRCPVAATTGDEGIVYVADTTLRAVLVYSPEGRFVEQIVPGGDANNNFRPSSVLFRDRILYVGNVGDHRVDRWNTTERQWLPPIVPRPDGSGFLAPTGLALTADGVLLIADSIRSRVFRVSPEGNWLPPIGRPGRLEGEFVRPKQVCVTPSGLVFVTDAGRQSVLVYTADAKFVAEIREREKEWRGFTLPTGLLALPGNGLDVLMAEGKPVPEPRPDEWVIVTDSLNASSLNLLGVFRPAGAEATTHAAE